MATQWCAHHKSVRHLIYCSTIFSPGVLLDRDASRTEHMSYWRGRIAANLEDFARNEHRLSTFGCTYRTDKLGWKLMPITNRCTQLGSLRARQCTVTRCIVESKTRIPLRQELVRQQPDSWYMNINYSYYFRVFFLLFYFIMSSFGLNQRHGNVNCVDFGSVVFR